jgi:hypothetical protein
MLKSRGSFVCCLLLIQLYWSISVATPLITSYSEQLTVVEGDDVTLTCTLQDIDENRAAVFWNHGDDIIAMNRVILQQQQQPNAARLSVGGTDRGAYNLRIEGVTVADEGQYRCHVAGYMPLIEQISTLTVNVRPTLTEFTPNLTSVDVRQGNKLELHCAAAGKPRPSIAWTRRTQRASDLLHRRQPEQRQRTEYVQGDDDDTEEEEEEFLSDYETLVVPINGRQDGGVYVCSAENAAGATKRQIRVDVQYKPTIEGDQHRLPVDVGYGLKAELHCKFRSNPIPSVTWKHDGVTIDARTSSNMAYSQSPELLQANVTSDLYVSTLTINGVETTDVGLYRCVIENQLGATSADFSVNGLPHSVTVTSPAVSELSNQYILQWSVHSRSPVTSYELQYETEFPVQSDDNNELSLTVNFTVDGGYIYLLNNLQPNTTYNGRLKATNVFGSSDWSPDFSFTTAEVSKQPTTTTVSTVVPPRLQRDHIHQPDGDNTEGQGQKEELKDHISNGARLAAMNFSGALCLILLSTVYSLHMLLL